MRYRVETIIVITLILFLSTCSQEGSEDSRTIRLETNKIELNKTQRTTGEDSIKVAISTMISPHRTFNLYLDLINYVSKKINKPVSFLQRKSYEEINELLENGYLDLAFICSGAYVEVRKKIPVEIIAVPIVNGNPYYYSYVIVPSNKEINDIKTLRGKKFAFVDPLSNTGRLYPLYLIRKAGVNPSNFFGDIVYTHSHDRSIELVSSGVVDGASVDSLVWDYYVKTHPDVAKNVKIINKSQPFGIPPFVSTKSTKSEIRRAIQDTLLKMHTDEEGSKILRAIGIERLEKADDSLYDSIREMNHLIDLE